MGKRSWFTRLFTYLYLENKIFNWYYNKIYIPIIVFYESLCRTIDFIPVIWRGVDFEAETIWPLLQKKLERMEKVFRNGSGVHSPLHANQIKIAIIVLDRLQKDDYSPNEKHLAEYPDLEAWMIEEKLREKDVTFLFEYIKKHYQSWWD